MVARWYRIITTPTRQNNQLHVESNGIRGILIQHIDTVNAQKTTRLHYTLQIIIVFFLQKKTLIYF
jgi:hypothetical protein